MDICKAVVKLGDSLQRLLMITRVKNVEKYVTWLNQENLLLK